MSWLLTRLKIASNGLRYAWSDGHIKYGVILFGLAIIIEAVVRSSLIGILILLILGLVSICFEVLNSSIEQLCDLVHPEHSEKVKIIKDTFSVAPVISYSLFGVVWVVLLAVPNIP